MLIADDALIEEFPVNDVARAAAADQKTREPKISDRLPNKTTAAGCVGGQRADHR